MSNDIHLRRTVKNPTTLEQTFGFLPPHGRVLQPGETLHIEGALPPRAEVALGHAIGECVLELIAAECARQGIQRPPLPSET